MTSKLAKSALLKPATEILRRSVKLWGDHKAVFMVGRSPAMGELLEKISRFSSYEEPILITGESGVGKELIAKSCHLMSRRYENAMEVLNCPQFQEGNLTVSELFGHKKGAFTGAVNNHRGHFETAHGGSVFLDEVADLPKAAQNMLLRALAEKEFKPLGSERVVHSDVRLVSATNRPLPELIETGEFREDLYFRLRYFPIKVPPLREREDDWQYVADFFLQRLFVDYGEEKKFTSEARRILEEYHWPGNVRELKSVVTIGYSMAMGKEIDVDHFGEELKTRQVREVQPTYLTVYQKMVKEGAGFWDSLYHLYMTREINRREASAVIRKGLIQTKGSYNRLLKLFNLPPSDYQRFMDFLRHHQLKPKEKNFQ